MLASATGLRVMREIPIDRVLTETDGPFLTRGDKPINPGDVVRAVEMIASSVGSTIEGVRSQIISNLQSLVQSHYTLPSMQMVIRWHMTVILVLPLPLPGP